MTKSSINFQKAEKGGLRHNDRTENIEPEYLLPKKFRKNNEVDISAIEAEKKINTLFIEAKENYLNQFNQKLQASSFLIEAVVNLNKTHTFQDVKKLVKRLERETGFTCVQISIHRDEGRIERDEDGKEYAVYNYHAHLTFFTLNCKTGVQLYRRDIPKSLRKKYREYFCAQEKLKPCKNMIQKIVPLSKRSKQLWHVNSPSINKKIIKQYKQDGYIVYNRERLSYLQTITAEMLKMERGSVSVPAEAARLKVICNDTPTVRRNHKQYRQDAKREKKLRDDLKRSKNINERFKKNLKSLEYKYMVQNEKIDRLKLGNKSRDRMYDTLLNKFVKIEEEMRKLENKIIKDRNDSLIRAMDEVDIENSRSVTKL